MLGRMSWRAAFSAFLAFVLAFSGTPLALAISFSDEDPSAWYVEDVEYASSKGYMNGYAGTSDFGIGNTLTRAELACILYNRAGSPIANKYKNTTGIADVDGVTWYTAPANWAVSSGAISGYESEGGRLFKSDDPVSREQLATILWRMNGQQHATSDVFESLSGYEQTSPWAIDAMRWATENKIITGVSQKYLEPNRGVLREEAAAIIHRYDVLRGVDSSGSELVDPMAEDSDGDGIPDYAEESYLNTDPTNEDDLDAIESKIVYADGVKVIPSDSYSIVEDGSDAGDGSMQIALPSIDEPGIGDIVVGEAAGSAGEGISLRVESVSDQGDGTCVVAGSPTELADAIEFAHASESMQVDWSGIEPAEGVTVSALDAEGEDISTDALGESTLQGSKPEIKFTFGNWGEELSLEDACGNNALETSTQLSGMVKFKFDEVSVEYDLIPILRYDPHLGLSGMHIYRYGLEMTQCKIEMNGDFEAGIGIKGSVDEKVYLGRVPLFGAAGTGLYANLVLESSVSGELSVGLVADFQGNYTYDKAKTENKFDYSLTNPNLVGTMQVDVKSGPDADFSLSFLGIKLLSVGAKCGFEAVASLETHDGKPAWCNDVGAWVYCETYTEILKGLNKIAWPDWLKTDMKISQMVFDENSSPFSWSRHYEDGKYVGGKEDCTWREKSDPDPDEDEINDYIPAIEDNGYGNFPEFVDRGVVMGAIIKAPFNIYAGQKFTFGSFDAAAPTLSFWGTNWENTKGAIIRVTQYNADGTVDEESSGIIGDNSYGASPLWRWPNEPLVIEVMYGRMTVYNTQGYHAIPYTVESCPSVEYPMDLSSTHVRLAPAESEKIEASMPSELNARWTGETSYSSQDESIATVSDDGVITGVSKGKTIVEVKWGTSYERKCLVEVA